MIKHLFCDLDGTLIVNYTVSEEDKQAIRDFVAAGGHFHIITGRTIEEINQFIRFEDIPVTYRIGNNGCEIYKNDTMLLNHEIDAQIIPRLKAEIIPFVEKAEVFEVTSGGKVYYTEEKSSEKFVKYKENNLVIEPQLFSESYQLTRLSKMYIEADEDIVAEFLGMLDTKFPHHISHYGEITNVNIGPKDVSKGSAIDHLVQTHGLSDFAVIGDGANDIPMFSTTDYSFSFHRAREMVTKHANHHVATVKEAIEALMQTWS